MTEKRKNVLNTIVRFGLSAVLLVYLYFKVDVTQTVELVKTADFGFIVYASGVFLVIHAVLLLRWKILIDALDLQAGWLRVARFFFIGLFGNLFLPSAIGGDLIKTIGLCSKSSQKPKVVASVILDRLSGFAGMVVVATVFFVVGIRYISNLSLSFLIVIMAIVSTVFGAVLFNERLYSFCCKIFKPFPKLQHGLMNVHYDVVLLKDKKSALYKVVFLSGLNQVFLAVVFYLVARALHQDIRFVYFLIFVPLVCVASCFPSIGGLGVREAGAAYLFGTVGVASGISVSMGLINFLFMVLVGVGGWCFFMMTKPPAT